MRVYRIIAVATAVGFVLAVPGSIGAQSLPIRQLDTNKIEKKSENVVSAKQQQQLRILSRSISRTQVLTWKCQDTLGIGRTKASASPWALPASIPYRMWVSGHWKAQEASCGRALAEFRRQWNWRAFPQWVIDLARCESSVNWYAEGSSSDGVFYSAFNISRSQYDKDAHHMGVRGWREGPGIPSPYEQAMAVIGHMRLLGDGFTGRCHGIARSSWN